MKYNLVEKLAVVKVVEMMMMADDRVDEGEIKYLAQLSQVLDFDVNFINESRSLNMNQAVGILARMSKPKKGMLYTMLNEMAKADGEVDPAEEAFLNKLFLDVELMAVDDTETSVDLEDVFFESSDHLRYQNSIHVSGPHGGAKRAVKIESNINGGEGYSVTIYNLDGNHPVWQDNIQMATKPMRIMAQTNDEIELRGFGSDMMGSSFADYGVSILHTNGDIESITLHMHDRDIDIKYLK